MPQAAKGDVFSSRARRRCSGRVGARRGSPFRPGRRRRRGCRRLLHLGPVVRQFRARLRSPRRSALLFGGLAAAGLADHRVRVSSGHELAPPSLRACARRHHAPSGIGNHQGIRFPGRGLCMANEDQAHGKGKTCNTVAARGGGARVPSRPWGRRRRAAGRWGEGGGGRGGLDEAGGCREGAVGRPAPLGLPGRRAGGIALAPPRATMLRPRARSSPGAAAPPPCSRGVPYSLLASPARGYEHGLVSRVSPPLPSVWWAGGAFPVWGWGLPAAGFFLAAGGRVFWAREGRGPRHSRRRAPPGPRCVRGGGPRRRSRGAPDRLRGAAPRLLLVSLAGGAVDLPPLDAPAPLGPGGFPPRRGGLWP